MTKPFFFDIILLQCITLSEHIIERCDMKKLGSEVKYCILCKEVHEVDTVERIDCIEYRGEEIMFTAVYEYCKKSRRYMENSNMVKKNRLAKDAALVRKHQLEQPRVKR